MFNRRLDAVLKPVEPSANMVREAKAVLMPCRAQPVPALALFFQPAEGLLIRPEAVDASAVLEVDFENLIFHVVTPPCAPR
jgi:hypothetical protein